MSRRLRVSDHALLRFFQRVGGMDIEGVRSALETSFQRAADAAAAMGGGDHYIMADGMMYLVRDAVVITVLDECAVQTRTAMLENSGHSRR